MATFQKHKKKKFFIFVLIVTICSFWAFFLINNNFFTSREKNIYAITVLKEQQELLSQFLENEVGSIPTIVPQENIPILITPQPGSGSEEKDSLQALWLLISPKELLALVKDEVKKIVMAQMIKGLQMYFVQLQAYPPMFYISSQNPQKKGVEQALVDAGIFKESTITVAKMYTFEEEKCQQNTQEGLCYISDKNEAIVFIRLESERSKQKCIQQELPYYLWSSKSGRAGITCSVQNPIDPQENY